MSEIFKVVDSAAHYSIEKKARIEPHISLSSIGLYVIVCLRSLERSCQISKLDVSRTRNSRGSAVDTHRILAVCQHTTLGLLGG